ncbi:ATP-binding cassette domain-containing protein [Candidatus Bathyarchaeota archaeon]|nr:ATP-binding cassette domain-containing protein [Candidatus Bathyarchaeota archaeon]MBS7631633.1 ATP-binding cassette domain-containing protein [Candidatus Bathyarchaeota archaeon]
MNNAISASELTKFYGDFLAVDHISFTVNYGEIFGFLGPNGAGKTTTIRMLTGVSTPTEGVASIMGYDIVRQSVEAKSIMGIVPDISNVYDELSAWANLIFTGKLYGISKAKREERATDLLKLFNLFDRRNERVRGFSRGMKRKVCIAMALMNDSRVLFLDEPTSGLDVESVREIRQMVRMLNKDGLTVFLTTHNLEEANQICDRIAIINKGKIAAVDTPEKLRQTMRSVQSVEVAFRDTPQDVVEDLKGLRAVSSVEKRGDKYRLITDEPTVVLQEIWTYAQRMKLTPISINTLGPSLEDVFMKLTGREMEEEIVRNNRMGENRTRR